MVEDDAALISSGASAGSKKPAATFAETDDNHFETKSSWVGYSAWSWVEVSGVVLPKRRQKPSPVLRPSIRATGASTCGDRTPPTALPFASRTRTTGDVDATCSGGPIGGATPVRTHASRWRQAAWRIQWCGPALTGRPQPTLSGVRRYPNIWV